MKKILIVFITTFLLAESAYALDTTLLDMRRKIFRESKNIKSELSKTKDVVLMSSMWDSCIMTMSQIDAYFYMLQIFNTIKKEDLSEDAIKSLSDWLNEIKRTASLNIKSLKNVSQAQDSRTKVYIKILTKHFIELNKRIDAELAKISILRNSLKLKK
jgi:hypothetical protein